MISVEVDNYKVVAKLSGLPGEARRSVERVVEGSLQNIRTGAARRVRVDTGRLKKSIHIVYDEDKLGGMVTPYKDEGMVYALVNELGRRPGARMPPVSALVPWVRRHHLAERGEEWSVAYQVARSIAKKGVPAQPYLEPSLVEETPKFVKALNKALEDLVG